MQNEVEPKVIDRIKEIILGFGDQYLDDEGNLKRHSLINALRRYDMDLMSALISDEFISVHYTMTIADKTIFLKDKFEEMLQYQSIWMGSYTKFENKIGITAGDKFIDESEDIVLDFPYKDSILKAGMSKEDRDSESLTADEPFLNETISKAEIDMLLDEKVFHRVKKYTVDGEEEVNEYSLDENLIIKGNNLLALHSLKTKYTNQIKAVFIDPPYYFYKQKKDDAFKYNSNFKLSTWLVFLKNRLEIAKELLSDDGVIAVTVGIDGYAHLKILMDEIFEVKRDYRNYIGTITWRKTDNQSNVGAFANVIDYILLYRKNSNVKLNKLPLTEKAIKEYSYEDSKGKYRRSNILDLTRGRHTYTIETPDGQRLNGPWMIEKKDFDNALLEDGIHWPTKGSQIPYGKIYLKDALENGQISSDFWDSSYGTNQRSADEIKGLFGNRAFDFAKPEKLIMNIISLISNEGDIVLDFFMGSATTPAVAMKMNRRFIGIEQMDYINSISIERLKKVMEGEQGGVSKTFEWQGGGSFIYAELMEKNRGYIDSVLGAQDMTELRSVYARMSDEENGADLDFRLDLQRFVDSDFWLKPISKQKQSLIKIIDKNQLYFNFSEIDDSNVSCLLTDAEISFNKSFYDKDED